MDSLFSVISAINGVLWNDAVQYVILGVGRLLVVWTRGGPLLALTQGLDFIRGKFDDR
jgi:hypothetical protein